ncbi:crotonase/enoyl-CoA hydratase family protein [Nocardioides sp. J54]|uniref:crotonase/enoyl-CoA hydratase family protein n=1 Tax=Nocardioides sp. J54 TaxID=935866 RepID=UPI000490146E|nr:crotonase/enoyl-CoA hydratase family protein [Nocardioides sp. J54]
MGTGLDVERRGTVLVLRLNRPHVRNAIDQALASAVASALDELDADDDLRIAVLTGAGGTFCSGMDLKAFARGERVVTHRGFGGITERPPEKPIIAAVEGWALAGGCEMALACDLLVAARDARFGIPEVKRGLVAAAGGLSRLPLALPHPVAMELALTGAPLPADQAHRWGLVNRLVEPGQAFETALELATTIAENAPLALRTSKWIMTRTSGWSGGGWWEEQSARVDEVMASYDATEGATAFAEKRPPRWRGR